MDINRKTTNLKNSQRIFKYTIKNFKPTEANVSKLDSLFSVFKEPAQMCIVIKNNIEKCEDAITSGVLNIEKIKSETGFDDFSVAQYLGITNELKCRANDYYIEYINFGERINGIQSDIKKIIGDSDDTVWRKLFDDRVNKFINSVKVDTISIQNNENPDFALVKERKALDKIQEVFAKGIYREMNMLSLDCKKLSERYKRIKHMNGKQRQKVTAE
ncbi:MAG: hypothetical protein LBM38_00745 [Clostridiales bacterium]|jgi:hypothetical protein|nr:hypothetical protein [Clostridiales bacterium]